MYFTKWEEGHDKSYQSIVSIEEGMTPIFKLIVELDNDKYVAMIKDFKSDKFIGLKSKGTNEGYDLEDAKNKTLEKLYKIMMYGLKSECIELNDFICPYKKISGGQCSNCKFSG